MGYDRDDSFPFNLEPNGNSFCSKLKGKLPPRSYPIECERKWKHSFLSVRTIVDCPIAIKTVKNSFTDFNDFIDICPSHCNPS